MDNIAHTVKEKMQKTYSFTGTQLLVTGLGVVILLGILTYAGRGYGWPRMMIDRNMNWWNQQMMQQYNRQGRNGQQRQGMMRWQSTNQSNNQGQPEPMMNTNQNNQQNSNQGQPTPPSIPTGTGN